MKKMKMRKKKMKMKQKKIKKIKKDKSFLDFLLTRLKKKSDFKKKKLN